MPQITDINKKDKPERQARKEMRDIRRETKEQLRAENIKPDKGAIKRDVLAGEVVGREAGRYGVDLQDISKAPLGDDAKRRITEGIKQGASKEIAEDIEGFSKAYSGPSLETPTALDEEALKESAKRQRKARWVDALYGFGEGLRGRTADPRNLMSTKLERERSQEFQTFRDISERNKKARALWEDQYRGDLIGFLEKRMEEERLSAAEGAKTQQAIDKLKFEKRKFRKGFGLEKEQLQLRREELKARTEGKYYAPRATSRISKDKFPLTKKYYELSGNSPTVINELAKMAGYPVGDDGNLKSPLKEAEAERLSNTLIKRMFKKGEDDQGNEILVPIPGMESYIDNISNSIEEATVLRNKINALTRKQMEELSGASRREKVKINANYTKLIGDIEAQLEDNQRATKNLLKGKVTPTTQEQTTTPSNEKLDEFFK